MCFSLDFDENTRVQLTFVVALEHVDIPVGTHNEIMDRIWVPDVTESWFFVG